MVLSTSEETAARRIGTTLREKWVLEELLGIGGMASVYAARHKIGRRDAIKILHAEVAASDQLRARFEQEAHAVNAFRHPGVVEIRDVDTTEDGAPFLVMELLEGESVADRLARPPPLETRVILELGAQTLDVLAAAHARGIIHRDIKPDNLFIGPSGAVKVLDFGIARVRSGERRALTTKAGVTLGTMQYMAPEQARGEEIDGRADVYALGATMFKLLTGRTVHNAQSEVELLMKAIGQPAPRLLTVKPDVATDIAAVIDHSLVFDRALRYPDAKTMLEDLRAVIEGKAPPFASTAPPIPDPPPPDSLFDTPEQQAATVPPPKLRAHVEIINAPVAAPNPAAVGDVAPVSPLAVVSGSAIAPRLKEEAAAPPAKATVISADAAAIANASVSIETPQLGSVGPAGASFKPTVLASKPAIASAAEPVGIETPQLGSLVGAGAVPRKGLPDIDAAVAAISSPTRISDGALPADALPSQRSWPTRVSDGAVPPDAVASQRGVPHAVREPGTAVVSPAMTSEPARPSPPRAPVVKTPFGQLSAFVKAKPNVLPLLIGVGIALVALLGTLIAITWFLLASNGEHKSETAPPMMGEPAADTPSPAPPGKEKGGKKGR